MSGARALFSHHAFVDLETTGLDPRRDEVIELGVLFVERGEVVRRISRLFSAQQPLPLAIRRLTGLGDEQLAGQPAFSSFAPELQEALDGWTVVAHNAAFERGFLCPLLERIDAPVLDSCELMHLLYPELPSHALESLVRWANVAKAATHRALKDCEDTFEVLEHGLNRCLTEDRADDLRDLLSILGPSPAGRDEPVRALLSELLVLCRKSPVALRLEPSTAFLPAPEEQLRQSSPRASAQPGPVTLPELDGLLGEGGALAHESDSFIPRPQQLELAHTVAQALNRGELLALEAGTGTGKSLAYLAPSALFAVKNHERVLVAPHTRALQDQLVDKELPRLHQAMQGAFSYCVLKGQANYVCRRRALELTAPKNSVAPEERAARAYLRAFLRRSPDGDLDRLSYWFKSRHPALGPLVEAARSEPATTLGPRCPYYHQCFFHSAVHHAKSADLLVTNQALLLRWPERYPEVKHVILDEAHELEDVATSALASQLSAEQLQRWCLRLSGRHGLLERLARAGVSESTARCLDALLTLGECVDELNATARKLCGETRGERLLDPREGGSLPAAGKAANALLALGSALASARSQLERHSAPDRETSQVQAALEEAAAFLKEATEAPNEARCYQLALEPSGFSLSAFPIDVKAAIEQRLLKGKKSLVLVSATLGAGAQPPWVLERLGLEHARFVQAPSPFELSSQALVVLLTDAPDPLKASFVPWAAERLASLAALLGGRVLGLFASVRRLEEVGTLVRSKLEPLGIEVLRQSRGRSRALASRQEGDLGTVLLGTRSFWQGLDIPGPGVACVFIDKLPLEPQSRPLVAAREAKDGRAGFSGYRLPRALVLLRQGVGRLLRSQADRGVVVIADPGNPSYRSTLRAALEGYRVVELPWDAAWSLLQEELRAFGLTSKPATRAAPSSSLRGFAALE